MRNFLIVLKYELMGFIKNKAFSIATLIICFLLILGLSVPTIRDTFFSTPDDGEYVVSPGDGDGIGNGGGNVDNQKIYGYINVNEAIPNVSDLEMNFFAGRLVEYQDQGELENKISKGEVAAGFIIESQTKYQYVVQNNVMHNSDRFFIEEAMINAYRMYGFQERGIEYESVADLIAVYIERDTKVLGTDSASNYLYTYILVFGLYFMILIYGQLVATAVASEKSNRAMEVLITSTDSTNLIFGKVIGGALAGVLQFGLIILSAKVSYTLNASAWNNSLDFIFKIPGSVILAFSAFGILGYLFYVFIFGTIGALVSRTEDINPSATPITIMFIAVFAIAVMGMQLPNNIVLKIASYIPFSSFMAMFVRVSMGTASNIEVFISLSILAVSTGLIGILASKIYRMGTLMYGNPIKIGQALKMLVLNK